MTKKNLWLGVGLALLVPAFVFASNLTVPNSFSAGTPIKSADVNANFAAVQTAVNTKLDADVAAYASGTRLAVLALRTSDGATAPGNSFFDRTLGVNCNVALASDSKLRCLPNVPYTTMYFSDATCLDPLILPGQPNPAGWPATTAFLVSYNVLAADGGIVYDVHQPTAFNGTAFVGSPTQFGCSAVVNQPTGLYALGPIVLPSSFAEFDAVTF